MPARLRRVREARLEPTRVPQPSKVQHASDLELARRIVRRDRTAEAEFLARIRCVPRYIAGLGRRCGANLRAQDVEELQQDVVYSVISSLPTFRGDSALRSWIYPICVSALTRYLRDRDRWSLCIQLAEPGVISMQADDPEAEFERLMAHLSPRQAAVCRLRFIHDCTFEEIAQLLRLSVPTAKSHSQRATDALRTILGETNEPDPEGPG